MPLISVTTYGSSAQNIKKMAKIHYTRACHSTVFGITLATTVKGKMKGQEAKIVKVKV